MGQQCTNCCQETHKQSNNQQVNLLIIDKQLKRVQINENFHNQQQKNAQYKSCLSTTINFPKNQNKITETLIQEVQIKEEPIIEARKCSKIQDKQSCKIQDKQSCKIQDKQSCKIQDKQSCKIQDKQSQQKNKQPIQLNLKVNQKWLYDHRKIKEIKNIKENYLIENNIIRRSYQNNKWNHLLCQPIIPNQGWYYFEINVISYDQSNGLKFQIGIAIFQESKTLAQSRGQISLGYVFDIQNFKINTIQQCQISSNEFKVKVQVCLNQRIIKYYYNNKLVKEQKIKNKFDLTKKWVPFLQTKTIDCEFQFL